MLRTSVGCGRPSDITEDLKDKADPYVRGNRRFTVDEQHGVSSCFSMSLLRYRQSSTAIRNSLLHVGAELREAVACWLSGLSTDFYDEEIVRLVQRLDKCLSSDIKGTYMNKDFSLL